MDVVLRTIFVFFLILVITRAVGRRELSSMEPFDLILLVVIGDLVQQGVTQSDYSLTGATMVIVTVALLTVVTAWLSFRFRRLRCSLWSSACGPSQRRCLNQIISCCRTAASTSCSHRASDCVWSGP